MTSRPRYVVAFFSPEGIVELIRSHPIRWCRDPDVTRIGGIADRCGQTPTSAVGEFVAFVEENERLPLQEEYSQWCIDFWAKKHWPSVSNTWAVRAKLEHNFYPSMIDTFHAFGLVANAHWYDSCWLDTIKDVKGKRDLTFTNSLQTVHVNLKGPATFLSQQAESYKRVHRGHDPRVYEIRIPASRPKAPGNKRWYRLEDFSAIMPLPGLELTSLFRI